MSGASRARKVRKSRARMNSTDSSSVRVWMWPFWFCWSTDRPARRSDAWPGRAVDRRWRTSTAGRSTTCRRPCAVGGPGEFDLDQRPVGPGRWPTPPGRARRSPAGSRPHGLLDPVDGGVVGRGQGARPDGRPPRWCPWWSATEGRGQPAACTLGAVDGRNCGVAVLLDAGQRGEAHGQDHGATIQPAMISQRNRTVNRPRAANKRGSSRDRQRTPRRTMVGHRGGRIRRTGSHSAPRPPVRAGPLSLSLRPDALPFRADAPNGDCYENFTWRPAGGGAWGPPSRATAAG